MIIGATIAESQRMKLKLNMLDHIIFPTDNDQLQFIADIADKNNSGAEVPIANTVNPISNEETLKNFANLTLVFIK
jgi:hypothetical protein